MPALAHADEDTIAGVTVAALACDAVVAVLPATIGLDAGTAAVWQAVADRGMPRAVVITELGLHTAGFEDLVAIAVRGLADDCVPIRLPAFDDALGTVDDEDDQAVGDPSVMTASLSLLTGALNSVHGESPAEAGHMHVCEDVRTALVSAAAGHCDDPALTSRLLAALAAEAEAGALRFGAGVRVLEIGDEEGYGGDSQPVSVWDVTPALVAAASAGFFVPVTVDLPDGTAAADLWRLWGELSAHGQLVRRDVHDEPASGGAAVVLRTQGSTALVRVLFSAATDNHGWVADTSRPVMITRPGPTADAGLAADRAWPGLLTLRERVAAGSSPDSDVGDCWWVSATPPLCVGDALVQAHTWVVPEEIL